VAYQGAKMNPLFLPSLNGSLTNVAWQFNALFLVNASKTLFDILPANFWRISRELNDRLVDDKHSFF